MDFKPTDNYKLSTQDFDNRDFDEDFYKTIVEPLTINRNPISRNVIASIIESGNFPELINIASIPFSQEAANLLAEELIKNPAMLSEISSYEYGPDKLGILYKISKYMDTEHAINLVKTVGSAKLQDQEIILDIVRRNKESIIGVVGQPGLADSIGEKEVVKMLNMLELDQIPEAIDILFKNIKNKNNLIYAIFGNGMMISSGHIYAQTIVGANIFVSIYNKLAQENSQSIIDDEIQIFIKSLLKAMDVFNENKKSESMTMEEITSVAGKLLDLKKVFSNLITSNGNSTRILTDRLISEINKFLGGEPEKTDKEKICEKIITGTNDAEIEGLSSNMAYVECFMKRGSLSQAMVSNLAKIVFGSNNLIGIKALIHKLKKDPNQKAMLKKIEKEFGTQSDWVSKIKASNQKPVKVIEEEKSTENDNEDVVKHHQMKNDIVHFLIEIVRVENNGGEFEFYWRITDLSGGGQGDLVATSSEVYHTSNEAMNGGKLMAEKIAIEISDLKNENDKLDAGKDAKDYIQYNNKEYVKYPTSYEGVGVKPNIDELETIISKELEDCIIIVLKWPGGDFAWRKMSKDNAEDLDGSGFTFASAEKALEAGVTKVLGEKLVGQKIYKQVEDINGGHHFDATYLQIEKVQKFNEDGSATIIDDNGDTFVVKQYNDIWAAAPGAITE